VLLRRLRKNPLAGPLTAAEPLGKVLGLVNARFFFREAAGRGWALVGDAGLFKDPAPGLGISDALRDARALAAAILEGGDAALQRYWRERDVQSVELFEFARDLGDPEYNNGLNRVVFQHLAARGDLRDRIVAVADRRLSPFAAFSTREVVGWVAVALLKGQFQVLPPFFASGKRAARVKKERALREELARAARDAARGQNGATRAPIS
jgi:hypothetical protein